MGEQVIDLYAHEKWREKHPDVEVSVAGIIVAEGPMMSDEEIRAIFAKYQTPTDPVKP